MIVNITMDCRQEWSVSPRVFQQTWDYWVWLGEGGAPVSEEDRRFTFLVLVTDPR